MKNFKRVAAALLISAMVLGFAGCGVKEVEAKDFRDVVKDVLDCDKEDLDSADGKDLDIDYIEERIRYRGEDSDKYTVVYYEYEDEEAAKYFFDQEITTYKFYKSHDGIEGKIKFSSKYMTVDASYEPYYDAKSEDIYGGIYLAGPYVIKVYCYSGKDKNKDTVDELLKELGLPRPSRA